MAHPGFYDPKQVGQLYTPRIHNVMNAGLTKSEAPASEDEFKVYLLLIDVQNDFVNPDGSLYVPGSVDDTRRTIEWLYANLSKVTRIGASLDTHFPHQIFYPLWWADAEGNHPDPFTLISSEDIENGTWQPTTLPEWSLEYTQRLEEFAKKTLTIWPYHCMVGTSGHAMVPSMYEAIIYHSGARNAIPTLLEKGTLPQTEYYSLFEPEVKIEGDPRGTINSKLLDEIAAFDRIYIAGQAKSHCVLESATSLVNYFSTNHPEAVSNLYILEDAMSSVVHPVVDFEAIAVEGLNALKERGLQSATTSDPV